MVFGWKIMREMKHTREQNSRWLGWIGAGAREVEVERGVTDGRQMRCSVTLLSNWRICQMTCT